MSDEPSKRPMFKIKPRPVPPGLSSLSSEEDPSEEKPSTENIPISKDKGKAQVTMWHTVPPPDSPIHPSHKKKFPPKAQSSQSSNNKSPFLAKIDILHACFVDLDPSHISLTDPINYAKQIFYYGSYFPVYAYKTRFWYELVLTETLSCQFFHTVKGQSVTYQQYNFSEWEFYTSYSKAIITRIISPDDWSGNFSSSRQFRNIRVPGSLPREFNYWDYIDAWFRAFLLQNTLGNHSWFLRLDLPGHIRSFPNWFNFWLIRFGPEFEIIPFSLIDHFRAFRNSLLPSFSTPFPNGFVHQYFRTHRIPWILSWKFVLYKSSLFPSLGYQMWIRWWDKFNHLFLLAPPSTPPSPNIFGPSAPFPNITPILTESCTPPSTSRCPPFPKNYTTLCDLQHGLKPSPTIVNLDDDPLDPVVMSSVDVTQILQSLKTPSPTPSPDHPGSSSASCPDTLFGHDPLIRSPSPASSPVLPHCFYCGHDGHYIRDCPIADVEAPLLKKKL